MDFGVEDKVFYPQSNGVCVPAKWWGLHQKDRARAGHLLCPVPHRWPSRGCTKGAHLAQCSYLGVWLYPPPPCISYALVQATVGVWTVIIVYVILITYEM